MTDGINRTNLNDEKESFQILACDRTAPYGNYIKVRLDAVGHIPGVTTTNSHGKAISHDTLESV